MSKSTMTLHGIEAMLNLEIRHLAEQKRFIAIVEGERCVVDYEPLSEDLLEFTSTRVPDAVGGRGVGTELVKGALDWAREHGYRVKPTCPFVGRVMDQHADYQGLRAAT